MKAIVKLSDRISIEVEEATVKETLYLAITLTQYPKKCVCGNTEGFYWTTNKDQDDNIYVNVKCPKCGARGKLGTLKGGRGHFWRNFEKYIPKNKVDAGG